MRILMVLDNEFPPDIRVEKEAKTLINAGHEVSIACLTRQNRTTSEDINQIRVYRKPISKFIDKSSVGCLKFPFYFNFWRHFIKKLLKQHAFDAIHIHDLPLAQIGYEMKTRYGIPFVLDLHENWPAFLRAARHTNTLLGKLLSSYTQWIDYENNMTEQADAVITVIDEMKYYLKERGRNPNKLFVVPNTVDLDLLPQPVNEADPSYFTLFYSGGINIHRGIQTVIKGLRLLKDQIPNIRCWIAGSGSYRPALEKLVKSYQLDSNVSFLGQMSYNQMVHVLFSSDIGLIPHNKTEQRDTTIPNKLFEYMYASKPVLSSDVSTVERILSETGAGLTYPYQNHKAFAQKVLYLYKHPEARKKMGINGKKAVIDKYNWKNTAPALAELYQTLLR